LQKGGSPIALESFAAYRARLVDPRLAIDGAAPDTAGLTAGPTLARTLGMLQGKIAGGGWARRLRCLRRALTIGAATTMGDRAATLRVIDGERCGLTTLLSLFGSRVVLPETG
jgi:hypothetical protein